MGLDPGYRRLFVEYLKEYASAENKTVFLTSHIIQDMEMLIDDCMIMSMGLDPGYRRLFVEYLKEYASAENKTVFLTSHIIQDMEMLIDDCMIMDMGLDPGYRRLFVEYLKEYASAENKTVFLTSHIIQDMEMLIDDCMIMDYGRLLLHKPVREIMDHFKRFRFRASHPDVTWTGDSDFWNPSSLGGKWEVYISRFGKSWTTSRDSASGHPIRMLRGRAIRTSGTRHRWAANGRFILSWAKRR